MIRNNKGIAETVLLLYVLGAVVLFFVPNKVSTALGIGNRQNKIVQTQKVEFIKEHGQIIGTKTTTEDRDEQQSITFWEWLTSLPVFVLLLMASGVIFPGVAVVLVRLRAVWKEAFKNQYDGLRSLNDTTVVCRKCGDAVTIDTKEHVFGNIEKQMNKRDKVLQEVVRTELVKK